MSQDLNLKAVGLWVTSNPLDAPQGALSRADNSVIRRKGIVEPRRGQALDAESPDGNLDALSVFEGIIVGHTSTNKLVWREDGTNLIEFTGDYTPPTNQSMRFAEAGGGLYFTTNKGPYRLDDLTNTVPAPIDPVLAGVPQGLEGNARVSGTTGWLPYGSSTAYRLVWGRRDADGDLIIGAPSGRMTLTNSDSVAVSLTRAGANVTGTTSTAHDMNIGDTLTMLSVVDTVNFTTGLKTITAVPTATTFRYAEAGAAVSTTGVYTRGAGNRDVAIDCTIPDGIVAGDFVQVYRSVLTTTGGIDSGEDMAQVGEFTPTAAQITARTFTVTDISSFAGGPTAYFSPSAGLGGLAASKNVPPLMTDMTVFKGYMFGVVQQFQYSLTVTLLATDGLKGLGTGDWFWLFGADSSGNLTSNYFEVNNFFTEGTSVAVNGWSFRNPGTGTASQNIEAAARSLVRVINLRSTIMYATYASAPNELPGKIILTPRYFSSFAPYYKTKNNGKCWSPETRMDFVGTPTRVANVVTVSVSGPHPGGTFTAGEEVFLDNDFFPDPNFPSGWKTITSVNGTGSFSYAETGIDAVGSLSSWYTGAPTIEFQQEATRSSYTHSEFEQYDAWPPRYRDAVGGPNVTLYRIIPQGNALLFWTSEGLYRLTGNNADEFDLKPLDPTCRLIGPNTVASMGNKVFALTDQGVVAVSDLGVQKISEAIDEDLLPYYAGTDERKARTVAAAFGVGYDSENEYYLFLPASDAADGDPSNQAYVFNAQTGTWNRGTWSITDVNYDTGFINTGFVPPQEGRLYLSSGVRLLQERKTRTLADYIDGDEDPIQFSVAYQVKTAENAGEQKHWSEVSLLVEKPNPDSVTMNFSTELSETPEGGVIESQGAAAYRTYVPLEKSRAARLKVEVVQSIAGDKLTILGLSVVYNPTSTRLSR